jgi:hypothetical protein
MADPTNTPTETPAAIAVAGPPKPLELDAQTVERVLLQGDLSRLSPKQKIDYYGAVCESVGLNPLTRPFDYLVLNGKEILYARREATEQLRRLYDVSVTITARELTEDIYVVTARATLPSGRTDENIGAVPVGTLKGEARANGMMKAETKAKRRVTLAICGLGVLDESERDGLPDEDTPRRLSAALARELEPTPVRPMNDYATVVAPPPAEGEPPAPLPPPGFVLISRIDSAPTKNKNVTKYRIQLSSGELVTTIKPWLAALAETCNRDQTPVKVTTERTDWGLELVALERQDPGAAAPPPTADKIPF